MVNDVRTVKQNSLRLSREVQCGRRVRLTQSFTDRPSLGKCSAFIIGLEFLSEATVKRLQTLVLPRGSNIDVGHS